MGIVVVNKYKHTPTKLDVYIGRGSPLGNPFTSKELGDTQASHQCISVQESIDFFEAHLNVAIKNKDPKICKELNRIFTMARKGDVYLSCFCKPGPCHGDIIKTLIESKLT